ncbi:MAG TPA: hypothetical protein VH436_23845 [Vicinamibacterales bacterium]
MTCWRAAECRWRPHDPRDRIARQPTSTPPDVAWDVWREEVAWMTVYFSVGVWTSLAMVLL